MALLTWQEFTASARPQGGTIPEDLRDFVENVSPVDRPALGLFRKTRVGTTFIEWLEDSLPSRGHNAYIEGVTASDQALTTPSRTFTHVQQFARWGFVSDTQRAVEHKGFADAYLYQERKAVEATMNDLEHTLHRGSSATGATSAARQFGGLLNVLSTNFTDSSGTTLTEEVFGDLIQLYVDNNVDVRPTTAFVNAYLKRTISLYSTKNTFYIPALSNVQSLVVEQYKSDFGDVGVYFSRDQLISASKVTYGNSVVLLDPSYFEVGFLVPLRTETLARDGLRTRFQVSAEATMIYRTEKAGGGGTGFVPYIA